MLYKNYFPEVLNFVIDTVRRKMACSGAIGPRQLIWVFLGLLKRRVINRLSVPLHSLLQDCLPLTLLLSVEDDSTSCFKKSVNACLA